MGYGTVSSWRWHRTKAGWRLPVKLSKPAQKARKDESQTKLREYNEEEQ